MRGSFGPWDQPELEEGARRFLYCPRCDVGLPASREPGLCADCEGLDKFHPGGSHGGGFAPVDPAYEISLHFKQRPKNDRTIATLDALKTPYRTYTLKNDPREFEYAESLAAGDGYPIVLITAHGAPVKWWRGYDFAALNGAQAAHKAAATPTEAHPGVPIQQEEAA